MKAAAGVGDWMQALANETNALGCSFRVSFENIIQVPAEVFKHIGRCFYAPFPVEDKMD
jgi:hypothetical protein